MMICTLWSKVGNSFPAPPASHLPGCPPLSFPTLLRIILQNLTSLTKMRDLSSSPCPDTWLSWKHLGVVPAYLRKGHPVPSLRERSRLQCEEGFSVRDGGWKIVQLLMPSLACCVYKSLYYWALQCCENSNLYYSSAVGHPHVQAPAGYSLKPSDLLLTRQKTNVPYACTVSFFVIFYSYSAASSNKMHRICIVTMMAGDCAVTL